MSEVVPGVLELELEELLAGLRPATPDNLPVIGRARPDGLLWATGHFRNGILLAPLTAELDRGAAVRRAAARVGGARRPATLRRGAAHEGRC